MGAKLYGQRAGQNDNQPRVGKSGPLECPLNAEERRVAPVIAPEVGYHWYCLVTVPQGEYRCSDALSDAGVASYVPTQVFWQKRQQRKELVDTEIQAPLFRGYVFARLTAPRIVADRWGDRVALASDWDPVFARNVWGESVLGIRQILGRQGRPAPMPCLELGKIADEERAGQFDERRKNAEAAWSPSVLKHDLIRITAGPFADIQGTAENDNDEKGRVRVSLDILGRATLTTIALADLENLTRPQDNDAKTLRRA